MTRQRRSLHIYQPCRCHQKIYVSMCGDCMQTSLASDRILVINSPVHVCGFSHRYCFCFSQRFVAHSPPRPCSPYICASLSSSRIFTVPCARLGRLSTRTFISSRNCIFMGPLTNQRINDSTDGRMSEKSTRWLGDSLMSCR